ncbi:MAG: hypothetical protein ACK5KP_05195 [Paludibacteraceae bacterium]
MHKIYTFKEHIRKDGGLFTKNKSKIYISPGIKGYMDNGTSLFKPVVVHEMIHAFHHKLVSERKIDKYQYAKYSEAVAYSYNIAYYKYHGMTSQLNNARSYITNYPVAMSWKNISNLLNLW